MAKVPDILCIGSVLWDIIGRTDLPMAAGNDKPGRITRLPGGVALNIAMTLAGQGLRPALLSVVGADESGTALLVECGRMGLGVEHVLVDRDLPTDQYMAIEAQGSLLAALADAHSLEAAGARILAPLEDGRLGSAEAPWRGPMAIDGNLTLALLGEIAESPLFAQADLRLAPASPGKAERLRPFLTHPGATIYVNVEEAGLIAGCAAATAAEGARALLAAGARRALVTDGSRAAVDAAPDRMLELAPPAVTPRRVTGAGDTFMAAHIAAETRGMGREDALAHALSTAAIYVAG
jgi:sugar/nucleoside kinase (ribokinase family)